MKCHLRTYGDLTKCQACGLEWDTNDPSEPQCPAQRWEAIHGSAEIRQLAANLKRKLEIIKLCFVFVSAFLLTYAVGRGLL